MAYVLIPPPQYDHPYRDGPVIEKVLPLEEARKYCHELGNGYADACAALIYGSDSFSKATCLIILPLDGYDTLDNYRHHEIAHCNGWPANHSDQ